MRKYLLSVTLGFLLACAGALNSLTPELPFALPADTNTTNVSVNTNNGVGSTAVSLSNATVDPDKLQADIEEELKADGWTVNSAPGMVTGTKDTETLSVTITAGAGGGADFDVLWVSQ